MRPDNQGIRIDGASSHAHGDSTTLRFRAPAFDQTRVPTPSTPDAPFAAGDELFWVAELYQGAKHVGSAPHQCTADGAGFLLCQASAVLPGGEVTFQTALDLDSAAAVPVPVTGGSGCYRHASGQLEIDFNDDGSSRWALSLRGVCS
ncbi:hypothetical protein [Nocardioides guangzhouensis]|uniref:hypothetical protein n=1 Tax=Nocardioides guangzhouensis TaxID=2497878 RepID=UPI003CCC7FAC